jgi:hypothetical protein
MSKTRYGHSNVGGGNQDQAERKDSDWTSRQGGDESANPGRRGDDATPEQPGDDRRTTPAQGTNTQGELAGIGEASARSSARDDLVNEPGGGVRSGERDERGVGNGPGMRQRDVRGAGTDQPPRMGGPLGPDPENPHLPEGAQDNETQGTGAGGFDVGVNAQNVGAVHQGVREEREP